MGRNRQQTERKPRRIPRTRQPKTLKHAAYDARYARIRAPIGLESTTGGKEAATGIDEAERPERGIGDGRTVVDGRTWGSILRENYLVSLSAGDNRSVYSYIQNLA
jgi:hypothetical protein